VRFRVYIRRSAFSAREPQFCFSTIDVNEENRTCIAFCDTLWNFHIHTVLLHIDILKVFYSPTDAKVNCLQNNFKIYIKTDIKTTPNIATYTYQQGPINICSHVTTELTTQRCILIGCFNICEFSKRGTR
jgi:hypothetical protein